MAISDKNIIKYPRVSDLPAFRFPDVKIEGLDTSVRTTQQTSIVACPDEKIDVSEFFERVDVGIPAELAVEGEPRVVRKWSGTFVDAEISFEPARGAAYHQFRVSKLPDDEDDEE